MMNSLPTSTGSIRVRFLSLRFVPLKFGRMDGDGGGSEHSRNGARPQAPPADISFGVIDNCGACMNYTRNALSSVKYNTAHACVDPNAVLHLLVCFYSFVSDGPGLEIVLFVRALSCAAHPE
jgi:hypothetical protein